jgi:hypothetical protein
MRNLRMPIGALLAVLGASLLWSCRGKEGPQGPPGRDLIRLQEGYIRGTVKGRDPTRNQNFQLSFNYTYVPTWISIPGIWEPEPNFPNAIQIFLSREGEKGGYMEIELGHWKTTNTTWITSLRGDLLEISGSSASSYSLDYSRNSFPDTAYVTSLTLRGDSLVSGQLIYVKRSKTPPDTAKVEFSSRLYRVIPYQRQGQAQKPLLQTQVQ